MTYALEGGERTAEPVTAIAINHHAYWMITGGLFCSVVVQSLGAMLWRSTNPMHDNAHPFGIVLPLLLWATLDRAMDEGTCANHGMVNHTLDSASTERRIVPPQIYPYHSVVVVGEVSWRLDKVWSKSKVVSQTGYLHLIVAAFFSDALVLRGRKNGRIGTYGEIRNETVSIS